MGELRGTITLFVGLILCNQVVHAQLAMGNEFKKLKFSIDGLMVGQADNSKKLISFQHFQSSAAVAGETNLDALRVAQEATHATQRSLIKAMYEEMENELNALQLAEAENSVQAQKIQKKIDALAEQTSALTKQLTAYFTSKPSGVNVTNAAFIGPKYKKVLQIVGGEGVSYTRWGRTSCSGSNDTLTKVYEGYAGNSYYYSYTSTSNGGTNFLCLHSTPVLTTSITSVPARGSIRGVEYYFANIPFSTTNSGGLNFVGKDMPCVVCNAETKSSQVMIPARSDCPAGWNLEYWGYLISAFAGSYFGKSNYICLDNSPEIIAASVADSSSNYASPVGTSCGHSFPCPPYDNNLAVPCVVCSI